jgi:hypothetical protein
MNTIDEIQKLEAKLLELDKKQAVLDRMKEREIKFHQESVECYIGIIELGLYEKKNRIKNDNYEKESVCCKNQDTELVPILEAILNSIKLLNLRYDIL